jgi:2-pyrone-4,6-dicarboxylate lactonase
MIPAPHPAPHPPTEFTPPPGACDAHCHIFGPADRFPYSPDRTYTPPDAGYRDFLALQERLGLSRAVFVQASCHGTDNRAMADAIRRGNGRFAGVAMIDADTPERQIADLHAIGVRGIRFNFVAHLGSTPEPGTFWTLVDRVAARGWHIVLHFDAKDIPLRLDLLERMPTAYVIDHMARVDASDGLGQEPFQALLALMRDERCWVKLSGAERLTAGGTPPYDDVVPYAQALIDVAPHRVLWGTDWPHPNVRSMPDDGALVDLLARYAPDQAVRHRILVDNPARLYPFAN